MTWVLYLIIACGALSIAYGVWTTRAVLAADPGTARMQEIAAAIQEGAQAYLARQYTTIAIVGVVIFAILAYLLGIPQAIGFAVGAVLSGVAGYIGMNVSVRANVRTTACLTIHDPGQRPHLTGRPIERTGGAPLRRGRNSGARRADRRRRAGRRRS